MSVVSAVAISIRLIRVGLLLVKRGNLQYNLRLSFSIRPWLIDIVETASDTVPITGLAPAILICLSSTVL